MHISEDNRFFQEKGKEFIEKAQHPDPNVLIVGEVISLHQGWVEGALESVAKVLTKKWLKK